MMIEENRLRAKYDRQLETINQRILYLEENQKTLNLITFLIYCLLITTNTIALKFSDNSFQTFCHLLVIFVSFICAYLYLMKIIR